MRFANAILVYPCKAGGKESGPYRYIGGVNADLPWNDAWMRDNSIDFQEFMIMPIGAPFFWITFEWREIFHHLKGVLKAKGYLHQCVGMKDLDLFEY